MNELLKTPVDNRDSEWERQFLSELLKADVKVLGDQPVLGPDQFPYLLIETDEMEQSKEALESATKVLHWLSEKGIGLVINPKKEPYPDMVLTYGMIVGLRASGDIWNIPSFSEFTSGDPTEQILPTYARKILKQFLTDQGLMLPRFQLVAQEGGFDYCFSLSSLGNPPANEHEGVAEALSWFLPPNYSVTLAQDSEVSGFVAL